MYAVVRTGGKQHRVTKGEKIRVEKLEGDIGSEITLNEVLMLGASGDTPKIGTPLVEGAAVKATILAQGKGKKVRIFRKNRRKGFHKSKGHRQRYTELEVTAIA